MLELRNISKSYAGNKVLKDVSLSVGPGEIHSLIGENGAGKSTLMNILFGMPVIHTTGGFSGEIHIGGKPVNLSSPKEAMNCGIGMVHQEFVLLPGFTVLENVKLNRETTRPTIFSRLFGRMGTRLEKLDYPAMRKDVSSVLQSLDVSLDAMRPVRGLPVGYMQFIEIARELDKSKIRLLVLDEPTAVLTESEADTLLAAMRRLADKGISILFISHRLGEVVTISDQVTVMRDGEVVGSMRKGELDVQKMAEMMVGRKIEVGERCESCATDDTILSLTDLRVDMPGEPVKSVNLSIHKGEIFGIGGLAGQGKIGIANGIMGLYPASGSMKKNGMPVPLNDAAAALRAGMAFVSEDRRDVGLLLDQSIEENIAIKAMQLQGKFLKKAAGAALTDFAAMREHALHMIRELDIRCTGPEQAVRRLSGGNQQKVCIAGALTLNPDLLFVSEPTRGIDIGAKTLVLDLLRRLNAEKGVTIVITSSELAELQSVCDRIAIVYG
ncbi:sugar ABC transporter ATP-binding protein, partial [Desulfovibrio sp. OttesenSCG-928-I05]|nr:sugar ABC transporter ATP-binding protein [Desulfovibrio sp. OttesenSCG-928-I05]